MFGLFLCNNLLCWWEHVIKLQQKDEYPWGKSEQKFCEVIRGAPSGQLEGKLMLHSLNPVYRAGRSMQCAERACLLATKCNSSLVLARIGTVPCDKKSVRDPVHTLYVWDTFLSINACGVWNTFFFWILISVHLVNYCFIVGFKQGPQEFAEAGYVWINADLSSDSFPGNSDLLLFLLFFLSNFTSCGRCC